MPYSIVHNGKVLDYCFKKISNNIYNFYIGNIFVGQIFKHSKHSWSAVNFYESKQCLVDGFGSRLYAADYLLKFNGFI